MTRELAAINFDFLLKPDVQLENRVRPSKETLERIAGGDANHRHVDGSAVLAEFWSKRAKDRERREQAATGA